MSEISILVVDDDSDFRTMLVRLLSSRGYIVQSCHNGEAALTFLATVDVVLVDLQLGGGMDGIELITRNAKLEMSATSIVLTGQATVDSAVNAMRLGAYHYLTKPCDPEEMFVVIEKAVEHRKLQFDNIQLREAFRGGTEVTAEGFVAASDSMQRLCAEAEALAGLDMPVLITGETGTGKDVLASYIHRCSDLKGSFNALNCGALSQELVDAELFGHEKGAFTGADVDRPGLIESTEGGTLLLDEIGEMHSAAQVRLLRVIENGTVRRVGGNTERQVDVRILAATNRDLSESITAGLFRADLYHRLAVICLHIPPLRERVADVPPLAFQFLSNCNSRGQGHIYLSETALTVLERNHWHGNIRELRNVIERAWFTVLRIGGEEILPSHLGIPNSGCHVAVQPRLFPKEQSLPTLLDMEKELIKEALVRYDGNRREAAQALGMSERSLYRRIKDE